MVKHWYVTAKHKWWVFWFLLKTCWALFKRGIVHDASKFSKGEAPIFAEVNAKLKSTEYGSPEYYAQLDKLQSALDHHYAHNSHHPEHYEEGLSEMSLLDVIEMLCDWKAAGMRHEDASTEKSIQHNQGRFDYDEAMADKYRQFYTEIK
jgi:hypothetical protein